MRESVTLEITHLENARKEINVTLKRLKAERSRLTRRIQFLKLKEDAFESLSREELIELVLKMRKTLNSYNENA